MFANPGGTLAPEDILGRDGLVQRLWQILASQSAVLTSERRIGKTCVIDKMTASPPADVTWLKRDVEGLRSPEEFVEALWQDVEPLLGHVDRGLLKAQRLLEKLGGAQVGNIKLPTVAGHWKNILSALFEDVARAEAHRLVLFWDEIPLFLHM